MPTFDEGDAYALAEEAEARETANAGVPTDDCDSETGPIDTRKVRQATQRPRWAERRYTVKPTPVVVQRLQRLTPIVSLVIAAVMLLTTTALQSVKYAHVYDPCKNWQMANVPLEKRDIDGACTPPANAATSHFWTWTIVLCVVLALLVVWTRVRATRLVKSEYYWPLALLASWKTWCAFAGVAVFMFFLWGIMNVLMVL
jgi:hypothetical protein